MSSEIQDVKNDTVNALRYLCSVLVIVGFTVVVFFTWALCRRLRMGKKVIPPPTPLRERKISLSVIYPPSPHVLKYSKSFLEEKLDNISITDTEPPSYFSIMEPSNQQQLEVKLSPLVLDELRTHGLEIRRSSSRSQLICIPKSFGDLPPVHQYSPPPPYSPTMAHTDKFRDTFLTIT